MIFLVFFKKNKWTVLAILICLFLIFLSGFKGIQLIEENDELANQLAKQEIKIQEIEEQAGLSITSLYNLQLIDQLMKQNKSFFFVLGKEACSYCQQYKEKTLSQYNPEEAGFPLIEIDYELAFLFEDGLNQFLNQFGLTFEGTPTTVFVKNGELQEEYLGVLSLDELMEKLKTLSSNE